MQMIHWIRHGQGFHNVAGHIDTSEYLKWDYEDAHLTDLGWKQVLQDNVRVVPATIHRYTLVHKNCYCPCDRRMRWANTLPRSRLTWKRSLSRPCRERCRQGWARLAGRRMRMGLMQPRS